MDAWRPGPLASIGARLGFADPDVTEPQTRWLVTGDAVRLRILDWGGMGPPALLLHGGALSARTWDYVGLGLRRTHRLIAFDMRGHGESGWAEDYGVDRLAADALEVLEGLEIARAHVVGMSLGGLAAAELTLLAPRRVASLTMVDVAPGVLFEASAGMRGFMNGVDSAPSVEAVVEAAMQMSPGADRERVAYRMQALLRRQADGSWVWRRDSRRTRDYPRILARIEALADRAEEIAAPLLLARGGRSRYLTEAAAAAFAARVPDGRWVAVAGAGHNVQEDSPVALVAALKAFWAPLDRLSPA